MVVDAMLSVSKNLVALKRFGKQAVRAARLNSSELITDKKRDG